MRSGPWLDDDAGSSSSAERWGSAGSSIEKRSQEEGGLGEGELWAVEVGWFVGEEQDGGESTRGRRREMLTTVVDARTMAPLGAWKGTEARVSEDEERLQVFGCTPFWRKVVDNTEEMQRS